VGYELETPLGLLSLHHVHPISPREGFYAVRGHGLRHELLSGHVFAGEWAAAVAQNTTLRSLQLGAVAAKARERTERVLIVGDTNLPEGSRLLHELFGGYVDGFASVGNGFGYTFPADRRPWMRIDRMLASPDLAFSSFSTLTEKVSDHLCIAARIGAR
jgi:endonuclease/exonuclease/phosphatase family metal-dependent hydrolase